MRLTLDKLPGMRADLVKLDDGTFRNNGTFRSLLTLLRKCTGRNPKIRLNTGLVQLNCLENEDTHDKYDEFVHEKCWK